MKKVKDFIEDVRREIEDDREREAKDIIKERLLEIKEAEKALSQMKVQLEALLEKGVDDVLDESL